MIVSDEPDEDADALDDQNLLETYAGTDAATTRIESASELQDWPGPTIRDDGLNVDHETLAWFTANHANWRREMRFVLQAWAFAHSRKSQPAEAS